MGQLIQAQVIELNFSGTKGDIHAAARHEVVAVGEILRLQRIERHHTAAGLQGKRS